MTTYVTKTTRAPRAGRVIQCPHCGGHIGCSTSHGPPLAALIAVKW
jgi:NAD(P)H-dependent flavin oxidoreductase YrpB (nitropropane dioxygenase family)